ncbi:hypothetical protein BH09PAT1_BH09PAT1_7310 [soil metagenome]
MQQVVVIHGGNAFENYQDYLASLKSRDVSLEDLRRKDWKGSLATSLGDKFDILTPRMPNSNNARYLEWKIYFENLLPLFDEDIILVGHSLGGIFLAKYLSENKYPKNIKAIFLIAAPFNTKIRHPLVDFNLTPPLIRLKNQAGKVFIYHSIDDKVVHMANSKFYLKELPEAVMRSFTDRGHFNFESLPELVDDLKSFI